MTLVRIRPDGISHQELLQLYRQSAGEKRAELRDIYFREWAMRSDFDWWGIAAGAAFDEFEAIDRAERARS